MAVEWRPVPGFDNYEANTYGFIRNRHTRRRIRGYDTGDAVHVHLYRGKGKTNLTCNLGSVILMAWVGPRPGPGYDCSHLNGDHRNNRLSNLAWETRRRNMERRSEHGRTAWGEKHGNARLTEDDVTEIRARLAAGATNVQLGREYDVSAGTISHIRTGRSWRPGSRVTMPA